MDRSDLSAQPQVTPLPTLLIRLDGAPEPFRFTDTVTIGRDPRCLITLEERCVSRIHARIARTDGGWWVQDAHSTNGTYVNDVRVRRRVRLDGAATLRLGRDGPLLHVDLVSASPSVGTPPPSGAAPSRPPSHGPDVADEDEDDTAVDDGPETRSTLEISSDAARATREKPKRDASRPPNALHLEAHDVVPPNPSDVAASVPGPPASPLPDAKRVSDVLPPDEQTPFVPNPSARGRSRATGAALETANATPGDPAGADGPAKSSVTQYLAYYFRGEGGEVGEHTRLLREAYARAQQSDRQPFWMALGAVLVVCVVLSGVVLWQSYHQDQLEILADQVFQDLKRQDLALAQLRISIEDNRPLSTQLAQQERERRMLAARYDGYVQELGLHRRLSEEERIIHRIARVFGESEFSIPAGFVREVNETIETYWLGPGRTRFVEAVERAQANGYVQPIVTAMMDRGLPPEFFYLALQESDFRADAVGPRTRWGIAKGMWQFIPSTGRMFGLGIGPRAEERIVDPDDDRHDVRKATRAAAQYLQTIYATEAQASGLLVIASYNWGEHRVNAKLSRLKPYGIPDAAFEGMAQTPQDRNYWRFLTEYRDRIPEETRDYVLKVFAAAVIGSDPKHFGFDFENPLRDAIESAHASSRADAAPDDASTVTASHP